MIDVGNPNILVEDSGTLVEDKGVESGDTLNPVYDDPRITRIGMEAFRGSKIVSVSAPYVTSVGDMAFMNCQSLSRIDLPSLVGMADKAFAGCESLKEWKAPRSFKHPGERAFASSGIRASGIRLLDLSEAVDLTFIPEACCKDSQLKELKLPKGLSSIRERAFSGCRLLEAIEWPDAIEDIGASAFSACDGLKEIDIPGGSSQLRIADFAFCGCRNLSKIALPKNTVHVGRNAFSQVADNAVIKCDSPYVTRWDDDYNTKDWNGGHIVSAPSEPDLLALMDRGKKIVSEAFFALRSLVNEFNGELENSDKFVKIDKTETLSLQRVRSASADKIEYQLSMRIYMDGLRYYSAPITCLEQGMKDAGSAELLKHGDRPWQVGEVIKETMADYADDIIELEYSETPIEHGKTTIVMYVKARLS